MVDQQPKFEKYRHYLLCIARSVSGTGGDLAIDAEDAVHQTILRACQNHTQFRGDSEAERTAWLRKILWNYVRDTYRRTNRRLDEQALARGLEQSSARLANVLVSEEPSPSYWAKRSERMVRLGEAIVKLPEDQRRAVELRYLQELPVAQIADRMKRSKTSIAGLLQRGLRELRTATTLDE